MQIERSIKVLSMQKQKQVHIAPLLSKVKDKQ